MLIAVVTESFAPRADEVADTARHLVDEILAAGHEAVVVTTGVGVASYRGARVVRSRGLLPESALASCLASISPDRLVAVSPRVLGNLAVRLAGKSGIPTIAIDARPPRVRADRHVSTSALGADPVWHPGVDTEENHPRLHDPHLRDAWAKGNALVVGHVGEVHKEKVLRRLEKIAVLPDVRLVVIGAGEAGARLRAAGAKVTAPMNSLDVARGVASIDVLVQARKKDSAVPAVRRALASGVPAIGFATGGVAEVVTDGHNGLLVDPAAHKHLTGAVRRLVDDPALLADLAANARGSVAGRSWADAVAELGLLPHPSPAV